MVLKLIYLRWIALLICCSMSLGSVYLTRVDRQQLESSTIRSHTDNPVRIMPIGPVLSYVTVKMKTLKIGLFCCLCMSFYWVVLLFQSYSTPTQ